MEIAETPERCEATTISIECIRSCMKYSEQCHVVVMIPSGGEKYQCCHYYQRLKELTVSTKQNSNEMWVQNNDYHNKCDNAICLIT